MTFEVSSPSWTAAGPGTSNAATTSFYEKSSRLSAGATSRGKRTLSNLGAGNSSCYSQRFPVADAGTSPLGRLFVLTNGSPLPPTGPPTLSLHALLAAARLSFQDPSLDVDDVESMCVSLMEQVSPLHVSFPACASLQGAH